MLCLARTVKKDKITQGVREGERERERERKRENQKETQRTQTVEIAVEMVFLGEKKTEAFEEGGQICAVAFLVVVVGEKEIV